MMSRFVRSWRLITQSFSILKANKKLLIYPILSAIICIMLLSLVASPLWHLEVKHWQTGQTYLKQGVFWIALFLVILYLCNFIILFCNAAFVAATMAYLNQRPVKINEGFRAACQRLPQIYAWSLINATFSGLLKLLQSRLNKITFFVNLFAGITWMVISYFIIPILVFEKIGPYQAIKRSTELLKQTWGPALVFNLKLSFLFFIPRVFALLPAIVGYYLGNSIDIFIGASITGILLIFLIVINSALQNILRCVLYRYANTQDVGIFDQTLLQTAFYSRSSQQ